MAPQTPASPGASNTEDLSEEQIEERPKAIAGLTDEVVAAAVSGDSRAIGVLFSVLNPRLTRYLGLVVGRDADDVASDTWVEVMRSLPRYVGGADTIGAWVIGVGRNRALTHFRRAKSRPQTSISVEEFAEVLANEQDTYQSVEDSLATAWAMARIASLPKEQAEAVFLRTIVGLDAAGAGQVLGKNPGAIRTSAHRGLKRLEKELLAEANGEPLPKRSSRRRAAQAQGGALSVRDVDVAGPSGGSANPKKRRAAARRFGARRRITSVEPD